MTEQDKIDQLVKVLMADLMTVLHKHGITEVHVGAMMRLMGVGEDIASDHDNERIELSDDFAKYVKEANEPRPVDQTLH